MKDVLGALVTIVTLFSLWLMFRKMGYEGWKCLIPFYGQYCEFEALYGNGLKFLLLLIPFYNIYVIIKYNIDLAHSFGRSTGFGMGLMFLPVVFYTMIGFSDDVFGDGSRALCDEDFCESLAQRIKEFVYNDKAKKEE